MRRSLAASLSAVALLTLTVASALAQADPAAVVKQLLAAENAGNLDAALAFFTDDATIQINAPNQLCPCAGQAAIRQELARRLALHRQFTVVNSQVSGSTVSDRIEMRGDDARQAGVDRFIAVRTYTFKDGKSVSLSGVFDMSDPQTATFARNVPAARGAALPRTGSDGGQVLLMLVAGAATLLGAFGLGFRERQGQGG